MIAQNFDVENIVRILYMWSSQAMCDEFIGYKKKKIDSKE